MLPLRIPNNGIRAKVFERKIGLKLRVMRLNHVKSFYAFLLCFYNKRIKERGGRPRPKPLAGVAANSHGRPWAWLVPVGEAPIGTGSARGEAARGSPTTRAVAFKGGH
ncbi:hypothetical protein B296_00010834 [Ensete ventricosum]|uniref:Uncharacterized protein n=1 Tax=Ensete ventricosum TaxID=4639 RepID=A0A426YA16_ENSVE|nr:hypothetical protein B296_00010834 [Ensete ventricosum]